MEPRVPVPRRPRRTFERLDAILPMLLPRSWIVSGAIGLVLVVGSATLFRFEGVPVWRGGGSRGGAWTMESPAELISTYGLGFLFAWPALLSLGVCRQVIETVTVVRFARVSEGHRSRIQVTWLLAAFLAIAAAWGTVLTLVLQTWPEESRSVGWGVVWCLLIGGALTLRIQLLERWRRGRARGPARPGPLP